MTRSIYITGQPPMSDTAALTKLKEYEAQIDGLNSTITAHENAVIEVKRQISEIRKLSEPIRRALLERLGS